MGPLAVSVGWLSAGFAVPTAMGAALVVASLVVGFRLYRSGASPLLAAGALLGSVAVVAHLIVATGEPASRVGFLLGTLGGGCWSAVSVSARAKGLSSMPCRSLNANSVSRQSLAVGGILWIAGTVTVTITVRPQQWPIRWAFIVGLSIPALVTVPQILGRDVPAESKSRRLFVTVFAGAFLLPAAIGAVFGREILFVAYLIAVVIAVIGWVLFRVASAGPTSS